MNVCDREDAERFFLAARCAWSDFWRAKSLRRCIFSVEARLDALKRNPGKNEALIIQEEAVLEGARCELRKIRQRLFLA